MYLKQTQNNDQCMQNIFVWYIYIYICFNRNIYKSIVPFFFTLQHHSMILYYMYSWQTKYHDGHVGWFLVTKERNIKVLIKTLFIIGKKTQHFWFNNIPPN